MAWFESRETKRLRSENEELRNEVSKLMWQIHDLERKLYESVGGEREKEISDKLNLDHSQRSKLGLIFSVERCRVLGVPEEKIIHDLDEAHRFFTSEEP